MKNHLGTLGLLVLFCKLFSTAYMFHSTNKYSYFLIVSNKFAILSLASYSHIWEKTNNCGQKKCRKKHYTSCGNINSLSLQREKPFAQSTVFCFRKADHQ